MKHSAATTPVKTVTSLFVQVPDAARIALLVCAGMALVCGQNLSAQTLPLPVPAAPPAAAASAAPERMEKSITLKFDQAPLEILLQFYSELTGKTILRSPNLTGNVTLRTADTVPRAEAPDLIEGYLVMCGVALVADGSTLRAVPLANAHRETQTIVDYDSAVPSEKARGFVSRRLRLRVLDASQAQEILRPLMNQSGVVQAIEAQNALLVTDTAPNLRRMKALLDETEQQVARNQQLHVIALKHRRPSIIKKELDAFFATGPVTAPRMASQVSSVPGVIRAPVAMTSQGGATQAAGQSPIRGRLLIMADDATGVLVMTTEQENLAVLEKLIGTLDQPLKKIDEGEEPDAASAVKAPPARSGAGQPGASAP